MNKTQEQIVALAGLFQATEAVHQIAKNGECDERDLETGLHSLFMTKPEHTLDVYGGIENVANGLTILQRLLDNSQNQQAEPVRYAMALMHLERQLSKRPEMLDKISHQLTIAENQTKHFGAMHENVFEGLAGLYSDTISTFKLRIQVSGKPEHLRISLNAAKIRTLLLAGIRSAMLWRQLGGHRWHLLFRRSKLAKACESLKIAHSL